MPTMQGVGQLPDVADVIAPRRYPVAEFTEHLGAVLAGRDASFDRAALVVRVDDVRLLVDQLYRELQDVGPAERPDHIAVRIDAGLNAPALTWAQAQPLLRSALRPAGYTNAVTADDDRPWLRRLWPFVNELAILDTGVARRIVSQRDTEAWGVRGAQMFAAARDNIAALYPPQPQPERVGHLLGDGTSYCDAAVLVPGWLSGFATAGEPRSLAFFPAAEVLLVCTEDPQVAPAFFDAAERIYRHADVAISPQAYTIVGETIMALDAAGPGVLRPWALRARSVLAATEYGAQAERLSSSGQVGADVGSVELIDTPAGVRTVTAWRQGTAAWLLPQTDYVLLVAEEGERFAVPTAVLVDVIGVLDAGVLPPRYGVGPWPSEGELAALRAHAVSL
jgi:hypothetical protein